MEAGAYRDPDCPCWNTLAAVVVAVMVPEAAEGEIIPEPVAVAADALVYQSLRAAVVEADKRELLHFIPEII